VPALLGVSCVELSLQGRELFFSSRVLVCVNQSRQTKACTGKMVRIENCCSICQEPHTAAGAVITFGCKPGHTMCYQCYTRSRALMPVPTCGVCAQPEEEAPAKRAPMAVINQLVEASNHDHERHLVTVAALAQLARQFRVLENRTNFNADQLAVCVQAVRNVEEVVPRLLDGQTDIAERVATTMLELARHIETLTRVDQTTDVLALRLGVALTSVHELSMSVERRFDAIQRLLDHMSPPYGPVAPYMSARPVQV
jgi:hypothetical protein